MRNQNTMKKEINAGEPGYEAVYPLGRLHRVEHALAPRLDTLNGKTNGELWNWAFYGNETFPLIEQAIKKRYPGVKFVPYTTFGSIHSATEIRDVAALPEKLKRHGCDAVISGNGC